MSTEVAPFGRRRFLRLALMGAAGVAGSLAAPSTARGATASLVGRAKAEGTLNTIGLPPTWSNYGTPASPHTVLGVFHEKYGLRIVQADPTASSAQELASIKALKGERRGPDVVDVSSWVAVDGAESGLFTPYKVSTWDTIPADMKDPKGRWCGDYFGVISFGVNTTQVTRVPEDWSDLKKRTYRGMVSINGDPTTAGGALGAVFAAALANGGTPDDITPGIEFFRELKAVGNWNAADCLPDNISKGVTPIAIEWDYLNIAYNASFQGSPTLETVIPATGKLGNFYCQAISRYAPHPEAAKLWEEFVCSDEGQLLYLEGYAHPVRYGELAKQGKVPEPLRRRLPPPRDYVGVTFPTGAQTVKAAAALASGWAAAMG
jgi:putative spermidine/putrescine transport system substrate-binding protein